MRFLSGRLSCTVRSSGRIPEWAYDSENGDCTKRAKRDGTVPVFREGDACEETGTASSEDSETGLRLSKFGTQGLTQANETSRTCTYFPDFRQGYGWDANSSGVHVYKNEFLGDCRNG